MSQNQIRSLLSRDVSAVKRGLRDCSQAALVTALALEVFKRRPRSRLVAWLRDKIHSHQISSLAS